MSKSGRTRQNASRTGRRTLTIADERAHVPFALIAVLLLVSSIVAIGILEQRPEPVVDQDISLVVDRSETTAQAELRSASIDASHAAVSVPVINATNSTIDAIDETNDQEENFEQYLKLLIYLEAHDRIPAATQDLDSVRSEVSVPPVADAGSDDGISPDEAIDRVNLTVGDRPQTDLEAGLLEVTLEDVRIDVDATRDDVPTAYRDITVTVGTPVMQLNERTNEYEHRLNQGFFEGGVDNEVETLGQHTAARLYLLAYFKAGWDRFQETNRPGDHDFERVLEPNHTEVMANDAIFDVQHDVFGTRDPYADRTMRPGYLCMAYQISDSMGDDEEERPFDAEDAGIDGDTVEIENESGESEEIDIEEQLCDGGFVQEWLFGDEASGELPEVDLLDMLRGGIEEMDVMDDEEEISMTEFAEGANAYYGATYYTDQGHMAHDEAQWFADRTESFLDEEVEDEYRDEVDDTYDTYEDNESEDTPDIDDNIRTIRTMMDELYTVEIEPNANTVLDSVPPRAERPSRINSSWSHDDTEFDIDAATPKTAMHDGEPLPDSNEPIHELQAEAELDITRTDTWEYDDSTASNTRSGSANVTLDLTVDADYDFHPQDELYEDDRGFDFPSQTDPDLEYDFLYQPTVDISIDEIDSVENESEVPEPDGNASDQLEIDVGYHVNYFTAYTNSIVDSLEGGTVYGTVERDVERSLDSLGGSASSRGGLEDEIESQVIADQSRTYESVELLPTIDRTTIHSQLSDDLNETHNEFTDWAEKDENNYTVDRTDLLDPDEDPISGLIDHIEAEREEFVYDNISADSADGTFQNPDEFLTVQVRKAYFDRMYHYIDRVGRTYEENLEDLEGELDEVGSGPEDGANDILGFAQDMVNADVERDPEEIEGSPVLDDAQFEVAGSPTYMTHENITREQDSAVRPEAKTITDFDAETKHVPMTIRSNNRGGWPGIPLTPIPPSAWYFQINTWENTVMGEYARFEVSATVGDPSDADRLTYVREHRPVEVELHDGSTADLGVNEPIDFESTTEVVVIMPGGVLRTGGMPAVADTSPSFVGQNACSPTWDQVGPDFAQHVANETIEEECHYPEID